MKKQIATLLAGYLIFQPMSWGQAWAQPKAKIIIQVKDETGAPIKNVAVRVGFTTKGTREQSMLTGETDASGEFLGEGYSDIKLNADLRKEGYYTSSTGLVFTNAIDGQWLPWNPLLAVILRPVGKPVALYAKKVQTQIPALNKPCGYDLEIGDWVAPYGKGIKKDFIFTVLNRNVTNTQNFTMQGQLTFSDHQDGVFDALPSFLGRNSVFKWERIAPEASYKPEYLFFNSWLESLHQKSVQNFKVGGKEWEGYFFRVRTEEKDGKIVSAHYGKIRGGIEVDPRWSSTCTVAFTYYYNPIPNDRNLEWDTKKNLFGNLTREQAPRDP